MGEMGSCMGRGWWKRAFVVALGGVLGDTSFRNSGSIPPAFA